MNDAVKRTKTQATAWETIFAKHVPDKGPVSRIKYSPLNRRKTNNSILKCTKIWIYSSSDKMEYSYLKKFSTSFVIGEIQIKTMTYRHIPIRMPKSKAKHNWPNQLVVRMQSNRHSWLLVGTQNGASTLEDSATVSYKAKHLTTAGNSTPLMWKLWQHKKLHSLCVSVSSIIAQTGSHQDVLQ